MFNIKNIVSKITERGKESQPNSPGRVSIDDDVLSRQAAEGFLCPKCMKAFTSPEELQAHYQSSHDSVDDGMSTDSSQGAGFFGLHQEVGERYKRQRQNGSSVSQKRLSAEIHGITDITELQKSLMDALESKAELQLEKESLEQRTAQLARVNAAMKAVTDEDQGNHTALRERLKIVEAQLAHRESIDDAAVLRQELVQVQRVMDELTRERERERDQLHTELELLKSKQSQDQREKDSSDSERIETLVGLLQEKENELKQIQVQINESEASFKLQYSKTEDLKHELEKAKLERNVAHSKCEVTLQQLAHMKTEKDTLSAQLEVQNAAIKVRDESLAEGETELQNVKNKCESLEQVIAKSGDTFKGMEKAILDKDEKLAKLSQDLTKLNALKAGEGASAAIIQQLTEENLSLQNKIGEVQQQNVVDRDQLSVMNNRLAQAHAAVEQGKKFTTEMFMSNNEKLSALDAELNKNVKELRETELKLKEMTNEKNSAEMALTDIQDQYNELENEKFELSKRVGQLSDRVNSQEFDKKQHILNVEDLRFQLEASLEIVTVKEGIISDLQIANQSQLQEYLELEHQYNHNKTSLNNITSQVDVLKDNLQQMEVKIASLETANFELRKNIVELEDANRVLTQNATSAVETLQASVQNLQEEYDTQSDELKQMLKTHESELAQRDREHKEKMAAMAACTENNIKSLEAVKLEAEREKEKYNRAESDAKGLKAEVESLKTSLDDVAGEKLTMEALLQTSQSEQKTLLEKYYSSCSENDAQRRAIDDLHRRSDDNQSALHELGRENQILRLELEKLLGRKWTEDSDVASCQLCRKEFSLIVRKHHCRNCGQIFCNECSSKNAPVANNKKAVRVCDACYNELVTNM